LKKRLGKNKIGGPNNKFVVGYTYLDGSFTELDHEGNIVKHANPKYIHLYAASSSSNQESKSNTTNGPTKVALNKKKICFDA
jgi:hypothetical protein